MWKTLSAVEERSGRILKRGGFFSIFCLGVFIWICLFTPCGVLGQTGKLDRFQANHSKIRQPWQKLHFIVFDSATYFGLVIPQQNGLNLYYLGDAMDLSAVRQEVVVAAGRRETQVSSV